MGLVRQKRVNWKWKMRGATKCGREYVAKGSGTGVRTSTTPHKRSLGLRADVTTETILTRLLSDCGDSGRGLENELAHRRG